MLYTGLCPSPTWPEGHGGIGGVGREVAVHRALEPAGKLGFPVPPLIIRVPFFLIIFGLSKETPK